MNEPGKAAIVDMLTPLLDSDGIELVDVEVHGKTLRILVHKPGGLSLADCQSVNRLVHPVLEVHQYLSPYAQLEVASPGIDRPLRTAADFRRNQGRSVRIEAVAADGNSYEVRGTVAAVSAGQVVLTQADGKRVDVALSRIHNAQLELKW